MMIRFVLVFVNLLNILTMVWRVDSQDTDVDVWWYHKSNESCYHLTKPMPWNNALSYCQNYSGTLASIHTVQENSELSEWLKTIPDNNFALAVTSIAAKSAWFGLHEIKDSNGSRSYQNIDGSEVDFFHWNEYQPDDKFDQEDVGGCMQVNGVLEGKWNEFPCQHMRAGLCQKTCGNGSNICPTGCDPGWVQINKKCYRFTNHNNMSWAEAETTCTNAEFSGNLASFHSKTEISQFLGSDVLVKYDISKIKYNSAAEWTRILTIKQAFIGVQSITLYDNGTINGTHKWLDGSDMDFTYWNQGESNAPEENHCSIINFSNGRWFRINCQTVKEFGLCSKSCLFSCQPNPCQNGGQCKSHHRGYACDCYNGYTGINCKSDLNECLSKPCLNGATCVNGRNRYDCNCAAGFQGFQCETNIDECLSNPCLNRGTCIDGINGYVCNCLQAFNGSYCQFNLTNCVLQSEKEQRERIVMMGSATLSSTAVMIIVGITFVIFLLLRDFSYARKLHMCQEISLFIAHLLLLVGRAPTLLDAGAFCDSEASLNPPKFSDFQCKCIAVSLHYIFMVNFCFIFFGVLNSFTTYTYVSVGQPFVTKSLYNILLSITLPIPIVTFTTVFFFDNYIHDRTCWLNMDSQSNVFLVCIPAAVVLSVALVMAEASGMHDDLPPNPNSNSVKRTTANANSKGALFIAPLSFFAWLFYMVAVHNSRLPSYTIAAILNIMLAACILFFHTLGSYKARALLYKMCCCCCKKEETLMMLSPAKTSSDKYQGSTKYKDSTRVGSNDSTTPLTDTGIEPQYDIWTNEERPDTEQNSEYEEDMKNLTSQEASNSRKISKSTRSRTGKTMSSDGSSDTVQDNRYMEDKDTLTPLKANNSRKNNGAASRNGAETTTSSDREQESKHMEDKDILTSLKVRNSMKTSGIASRNGAQTTMSDDGRPSDRLRENDIVEDKYTFTPLEASKSRKTSGIPRGGNGIEKTNGDSEESLTANIEEMEDDALPALSGSPLQGSPTKTTQGKSKRIRKRKELRDNSLGTNATNLQSHSSKCTACAVTQGNSNTMYGVQCTADRLEYDKLIEK